MRVNSIHLVKSQFLLETSTIDQEMSRIKSMIVFSKCKNLTLTFHSYLSWLKTTLQKRIYIRLKIQLYGRNMEKFDMILHKTRKMSDLIHNPTNAYYFKRETGPIEVP